VDGTACGLRPAGNFSKIIDIENCPVQSDRANTILNLFRKVLKQFDSAGYRRENGTGIIKYATIRSGKTGSLILTCDRENLENDSSCVFHDFSQVLIQEIQNNSSENFSLIICTTERNSDLSCTPGGKVIYGSETFTIEMGGLQFQTPYDAFFQPNPECFQLLLEKSSEAILQNHDLLTEGNLLDLYSGSGILSAVLLEKLQPVLKNKIKNIKGYDFTDSAVNNAEKNFASFQGFLSFHSADLNKKFSDDESPFRDPVSLMIADPPRAGISPNLLKNIVESSEAPLFLYISCNPESQIRDLKKLIEKYTPVKAWIADCFPHTGHLEQAVLLKLKD
ncbi:MAG: hypothetical protein OEZ34_09610, partial [Spirochaetia bacterium]|nr:hypothetical protein [Spirochaetia bacterium]